MSIGAAFCIKNLADCDEHARLIVAAGALTPLVKLLGSEWGGEMAFAQVRLG
jgi:hypothetical protein